MEEFRNHGLVDKYFEKSYGWAAFPKVGKFAFMVGVGGADGEVYVKNESGVVQKVGNSKLALVSGGWSLGVTIFSKIIFFENKEAYQRFIKGNFEFEVGAKVHVLNAGGDAAARTTGSGGSASITDASGQVTDFGYHNGMATFVLPKMGAMIDVSAQGQKFFYEALTA